MYIIYYYELSFLLLETKMITKDNKNRKNDLGDFFVILLYGN